MLIAGLLAGALLQAGTATGGGAAPAPEEPAALRSLTITVTHEKGGPVESLTPEDVAVVENGVARLLTRLEADRRPLTLVLLVDSSAAVGSGFRQNVVPSVTSFLRQLPPGSSYSVWTTGDRPTRIVEPTTDPNAAERALSRVALQGGNTVLDALVEAPREDLKNKEGERTAVVVVTSLGMEFSGRERRQVVDEAQRLAGLFLAVQYQNEGESSFEDRAKYGFVLEELAKKSGGVVESPLSSMSVPPAMERLAAELRGQYRLTYATVPGLKEHKVEVKVARPGVKVRVGAGRS